MNKLLKNHLENIKETYRKHMLCVNVDTKEKFNSRYIVYKKNTGRVDDDQNIIYETKEARIIDTAVTQDHDIMFDVIDKKDNLDIIFSYNIIEIKE